MYISKLSLLIRELIYPFWKVWRSFLSVSLPVFHQEQYWQGLGSGRWRWIATVVRNEVMKSECLWTSVILVRYDCRCGSTNHWTGESFDEHWTPLKCPGRFIGLSPTGTTIFHGLRNSVFQSLISSFVQWGDLCLHQINCVMFPTNWRWNGYIKAYVLQNTQTVPFSLDSEWAPRPCLLLDQGRQWPPDLVWWRSDGSILREKPRGESEAVLRWALFPDGWIIPWGSLCEDVVRGINCQNGAGTSRTQ